MNGYLSCHDFADNQVRLQLFALAYNLGNFLRRLALPASVKHWTLTTLRDKLIKIGAKVVRHARCVTFCDSPGVADSGLGSTYATFEAGALTASYCSGVR